jgi:peptidoglycan/LPS O-acetylase OafA/YrhL
MLPVVLSVVAAALIAVAFAAIFVFGDLPTRVYGGYWATLAGSLFWGVVAAALLFKFRPEHKRYAAPVLLTVALFFMVVSAWLPGYVWGPAALVVAALYARWLNPGKTARSD